MVVIFYEICFFGINEPCNKLRAENVGIKSRLVINFVKKKADFSLTICLFKDLEGKGFALAQFKKETLLISLTGSLFVIRVVRKRDFRNEH